MLRTEKVSSGAGRASPRRPGLPHATPRTRGRVPAMIRAPCRAAPQAIPPVSLCLKRRRVKSRGVAWDTTGWGHTTRGAHGERVACPAAWVVRHAREGRPTQRPEGSRWWTWGSAPPGSGPQRWRSRCSRRRRASTPLASDPRRGPAGSFSGDSGIAAGLVGSLRGDGARQRLPVWELSVALERGRGDVTPAGVGPQIRSRGPRRRVGCRARGCARRPVCPGPAGATAGCVASRPVGRQRGANTAEHAGLELPHHLADILQLSRARAM